MSIQLKSLAVPIPSFTVGVFDFGPSFDSSLAMIPQLTGGAEAMVLYTAPAMKAALIANIRIINTDTQQVAVNLFVGKRIKPVDDFTMSFQNRIRILPKDYPIAPNSTYVDDWSLVLEPGDTIEGFASKDKVVQILINGCERDSP